MNQKHRRPMCYKKQSIIIAGTKLVFHNDDEFFKLVRELKQKVK